MMTVCIDDETPACSYGHFGQAYYAALVTVLYVRGVEAMLMPDGLRAAIWFKPFSLALLMLFCALLLAPLALLNGVVLLQPLAAMRAARWRSLNIWARWTGYVAILIAASYYLTRSNGLRGVLLGLLALVLLTVLHIRFQQARRPLILCGVLVALTVIVPIFLRFHPAPFNAPPAPIVANMPIIWVTKSYAGIGEKTPVYWQPEQTVYLQWQGKNYRLQGMSPAFAFRRHTVLTLDRRDLLITPLAGTPQRIHLKPYLPNYQFIVNMQPTPDGVMFNVYAPPNAHHVLRINFATGQVQPVPQAFRVRAAEGTDRYVANWDMERPHQVRDGHDRVLRQHGLYPWHFHEWDADPVDDIFAITSRSDVTLIGPDSLTMSTIDPDMRIASVTMQPDLRQIWIAEQKELGMSELDTEYPCRLRIYAYNGHCLGERTLIGAEVIRALPVEEPLARLLVHKYAT